MRKIPTLFVRDYLTRPARLTEEVTPGCEWVLAGEGVATRKWEGTHVYFDGRSWWARREVKPGQQVPGAFVEEAYDAETGKRFGRVPAQDSAFIKPLLEAIRDVPSFEPGGYELCGPKINKNPEGLGFHVVLAHAHAPQVRPFGLSFEQIRETVQVLHDAEGFEGLVWHHPDGRMAKIKYRDYV